MGATRFLNGRWGTLAEHFYEALDEVPGFGVVDAGLDYRICVLEILVEGQVRNEVDKESHLSGEGGTSRWWVRMSSKSRFTTSSRESKRVGKVVIFWAEREAGGMGKVDAV